MTPNRQCSLKNFLERPQYNLSKILCVIAYEIVEQGKVLESKDLSLYVFRMCVYSTIFVLGNFFVSDIIRTLDKIAFLFANVMLITLTIYIMIWSILYKKKQAEIVSRLGNIHSKYPEWIETILMVTYYLTICGTIAYFTNINLILTLKYCILFVMPDLFSYGALFQYINTVLTLRRRILLLTEKAQNASNLKKIVSEYKNLYLVTVKINAIYGLLCLWTVATFFIWIMCDLYRLMNYLEHRIGQDNHLISGLIAAFSHYLSLFYISALCNSTKVHWMNFKIVFYKKMLLTKLGHSLKKRYCLLLLHEDLKLTALDWFEIDYLLIYTISGAIISYLVLFDQLHL